MRAAVTDIRSTFFGFVMQRAISRKRFPILHFRLWNLHFWCFMLLLESTANAPDVLERPTTSLMSTEIQDSPQLSSAVRSNETFVEDATSTDLYSHSRVLHQQEGGSTVEEQVPCTLNATLISTFYDESSQIWTVNSAMLREIDNNLQRIVDCAFENDTIYFRMNGTIRPETTIDISFPLTLRGESGTTLTCPQQGALLISRTSSFIIENFIISGCNGTSGILILGANCSSGRTYDTIVVSHVTFERNAVFEEGHIIEANSLCSELEINGLVFLHNRCIGTHCMFLGARNTLTSVYLVNNHGSSETSLDSSIFFASIGSQTVATNVTSMNNTIRSFYLTNGDLRMTDSHFAGNRRNQSSRTRDNSIGGGVLFTNHSLISISTTIFEHNSAFNGGALFAWSSNVSIEDCIFRENDALRGNGGALYGHDDSSFGIYSSVFSKNRGYFGAGLYSNYTMRVDMTNVSVWENNCSRSCAITIDYGSASIEASEFFRNSADRAGAALCTTESKLSLKNSTFFANNARFGGACFFEKNSTVRASNLFFENNTARETDGGGIYLTLSSLMRLRDSMFRNNYCLRDGGAIYSVEESEAFLKGVVFLNNTSGDYAGALQIWTGNFSGTNLTFTRNRAASYGGAVSFFQVNNVSVSNSHFEGNVAARAAAVQFYSTSSGYINQCTFVKNMGHDNGGVIRTSASNVSISSCVFRANASPFGGSLLLRNRCNCTILNSKFENNTAERRGGAIDMQDNSELTISHCEFRNNSASDSGGGIALVNASSLLCYSCWIVSNRAFSGAGLYVYSNNSILIVAQLQNSRFENNSAASHGGGIEFASTQNRSINCSNPQMTCGHIILLNTSFKGNYANHSGAIVLTTDPNLVLVNCEGSRRRRSQSFVSERDMESLDVLNPKQMCTSWERNRVSSTAYGDTVGTYGQEIVLAIDPEDEVRLVGNTTSGYVLENVSSGRQLPTINVTILDGYGVGPAPTLPYYFEARLSSPDELFTPLYPTNIVAGFGSFTNISNLVPPGNHTLEFSFDNPAVQAFNVTLVVRDCLAGEELTTDGISCQECDLYTYNFNTSKVGGCKECPGGGTCTGRYIVPNNGHWHSSPCHDQVKECLVEDACQYENRARDLTNFTQNSTDCNMNETELEAYRAKLCNEGHEGPLCGSCRSSFGLSFQLRCLKCPHKAVSFLVIVGMTTYLLSVAAFTIRGCLPFEIKRGQNKSRSLSLTESRGVSVQDPEVNIEMVRMIVDGHVPPEYFRKKQEEASTSQAPVDSTRKESDHDLAKWKMTETFKIIINFLQTTAVATSVDLEWTDGMNELFEVSEYIGAVATSAISRPMDCLASSVSKFERAMWKMLLSLFVPIFVMLMCAAFWGFMAFRAEESISYLAKRTVLSVIAVTYISYLGVTRVAVKAFYCVDVYDSDDPLVHSTNQYLASDTSIECYKNDHFSLVAIAIIVLAFVTLAFPLVSGVVLWRNKQRDMTRDNWKFETFGFLFRPFKESCHFWESLVMLRKACLSVIVVFSYPLGGLPQGILALLVLLTSHYIHLTIRPYRKEFEPLNSLESASLLVSCFTFTLGLFFFNNTSSESVRAFLSVLIIGANTIFFMFLLSAFFKSGIGHLKVVLHYEDVLLHDQVPWWRVLKISITTRFRNPF